MKFLIAGFGSIGRRHFRNLKSLGQQDILLLRSGNSRLPDEELAGHSIERDLESALAYRPDAVIIANPTSLHMDVAIHAAKLGCHLLIEKPISHNVNRLDELVKTVRETGSRVLVGFQFRFHPTLRQAKETLDSGGLGEPLSAKAHWGEYLPDWHPWEDYRRGYSARGDLGGGVVLTLSHPFDYLRWLMGEISSVTGEVSRSGQLDIDVEDQCDAQMGFTSGVSGNVHLDYLERPPSHWLRVVCSKGSFHWNALDGSLSIKRSGSQSEQEIQTPSRFERNDLFLSQMTHFIEVVRGTAQPQCTLDDGIKALQIALAVHVSAKEKKQVVL